MCENNKIYIVLSQTGALTSKALRLFTFDRYNHISISLTPTLEKMYSFGRIRPNNPFIGGFVEEGKNIGTFKKYKKTSVMVLELEVEQTAYDGIKIIIDYMLQHKSRFKYNFLGVVLAYFRKNYKPKNKFYCSQFVRFCLERFNISNVSELPKAVKPMDFLKLNNTHTIYKGLLTNYCL